VFLGVDAEFLIAEFVSFILFHCASVPHLSVLTVASLIPQ
jgi:hypothetical protein